MPGPDFHSRFEAAKTDAEKEALIKAATPEELRAVIKAMSVEEQSRLLAEGKPSRLGLLQEKGVVTFTVGAAAFVIGAKKVRDARKGAEAPSRPRADGKDEWIKKAIVSVLTDAAIRRGLPVADILLMSYPKRKLARDVDLFLNGGKDPVTKQIVRSQAPRYHYGRVDVTATRRALEELIAGNS